MNVVELNKYIAKVALATPLVESYYNDSPYDIWNTKEVKYGSVCWDVTASNIFTSYQNYRCLFYYGDRLTENRSNRNAIRTDAINVLKSIMQVLYETDGMDVTFSETYNFYEQDFEDELCGAWIECTITVSSDGICGFDVEVKDEIEVKQIHDEITENGIYEWRNSDVYYDQVVIDVDVPKGLPVDFEKIGYDDADKMIISQDLQNDINQSETLYVGWNPNRTSAEKAFMSKSAMIYAPKVDTSNVTNMANMFASCGNLEYAPYYDTSKVTDMLGMFYKCRKLKRIGQYDTSNVISMGSMFFGCYELNEVPYMDTHNVTDMNYMFYDCGDLSTVPFFDTSNVTNMSYMFQGSGISEIPHFDTYKVNTFKYTFAQNNLKTIPNLDTSNATNMSYMFYNNVSLQNIPQIDTSNVTNADYMFCQCGTLKELPLLDFGNVTQANNLIQSCNQLVTLGGFKDIKVNLVLPTYNRTLTYESIMNVIYNLYDLASNGLESKTLQVGYYNFSKLNEDDIAIATSKGWIVEQ